MRVMKFGVGPKPVLTVSEQAQQKIDTESIFLDTDDLVRAADAMLHNAGGRNYERDQEREVRSLLTRMVTGRLQPFTDTEEVTHPRIEIAVTLPEAWRAAQLRRKTAIQGRKAGKKAGASVKKAARKGCNALGQRLIGPPEAVTPQSEEKCDQSVTGPGESVRKTLFGGDSVRAQFVRGQRDAAVAKGGPWYPVADDELGDLTEFIQDSSAWYPGKTPAYETPITTDQLAVQAQNLLKAVEALRNSSAPEQTVAHYLSEIDVPLFQSLIEELAPHYRIVDMHGQLHLGTKAADPVGTTRCSYSENHPGEPVGNLYFSDEPLGPTDQKSICPDCWRLRNEDYSTPRHTMSSGERVYLPQELVASGMAPSQHAGRKLINTGHVRINGVWAPSSKYTYDRTELADRKVTVLTEKTGMTVLFVG